MIHIVPAIDILDGKCVRLIQGNYDLKKVYNDDPVQVALEFERYGIHRIHVVDLDGARSKHVVNVPTLKLLNQYTSLKIDFGGGIKSDADLRLAFSNGATQVTVGSIAAQDPELFLQWLKTYGANKIILGADVREGRISINGWKEDSAQELIPFLKPFVEAGVTRVLCTDINHDGMLNGPSIDLYKEVLKVYPGLKLAASGGVRNIDDVKALQDAGLHSVIIGKAIYEGGITLKEINQYIQEFSQRD